MNFVKIVPKPEVKTIIEYISENGRWQYSFNTKGRFFPHSIRPAQPPIPGAWGATKLEAMIKVESACRKAAEEYIKLADQMLGEIEKEKGVKK